MPTAAGAPRTQLEADRLLQIERDNASLLRRIQHVPPRVAAAAQPPVRLASSFAQAQRRQARDIERANLRLLRKLEATKPTLRTTAAAAAPAATKPLPPQRSAPPAATTTSRPSWRGACPAREDGRSRDLAALAVEACPERHLEGY
jgi:hypothetical protein